MNLIVFLLGKTDKVRFWRSLIFDSIKVNRRDLIDKVISKLTTNLELERTRGIRLFN